MIKHLSIFLFQSVRLYGHSNECIEDLNYLCQYMKEGGFFLKKALNTFNFNLYDIRYMVKNSSASERGYQQPPLHGILFLNTQQGIFYMHIR